MNKINDGKLFRNFGNNITKSIDQTTRKILCAKATCNRAVPIITPINFCWRHKGTRFYNSNVILQILISALNAAFSLLKYRNRNVRALLNKLS